MDEITPGAWRYKCGPKQWMWFADANDHHVQYVTDDDSLVLTAAGFVEHGFAGVRLCALSGEVVAWSASAC